MAEIARISSFILAIVVGRYLGSAASFWIEMGEPVLDPSRMFSPWIAAVATIAGGTSYLVAMVWLKGRSVWLTALTSALVAVLLYIPTMIVHRKDYPQGVFALMVFVQWFAIGALAHVAVVLADRRLATLSQP